MRYGLVKAIRGMGCKEEREYPVKQGISLFKV